MVIDGDGRVCSVLADADGADGDKAFAGYDGAGERRQVVFLADGIEQRVQILRSWRLLRVRRSIRRMQANAQTLNAQSQRADTCNRDSQNPSDLDDLLSYDFAWVNR